MNKQKYTNELIRNPKKDDAICGMSMLNHDMEEYISVYHHKNNEHYVLIRAYNRPDMTAPQIMDNVHHMLKKSNPDNWMDINNKFTLAQYTNNDFPHDNEEFPKLSRHQLNEYLFNAIGLYAAPQNQTSVLSAQYYDNTVDFVMPELTPKEKLQNLVTAIINNPDIFEEELALLPEKLQKKAADIKAKKEADLAQINTPLMRETIHEIGRVTSSIKRVDRKTFEMQDMGTELQQKHKHYKAALTKSGYYY